MDDRKILELSEPMSLMYSRVASQLIINIARHFKDEREITESAAQWRIKKLSELGALTEESVAIIANGTGRKNEYIRDAVGKALGITASEVDALMAAAALPPAPLVSASPSMAQVLDMFAAQAEQDTNLVNTVMLESTRSRYLMAVDRVVSAWEKERIEQLTETVSYEDLDAKLNTVQKIMNAGAGEAVTGAFSYTRAIRDAVKWLADEGVKGFVDIGGHEWTPEAYVSMDIRTTIHNTAIKAQQTRAAEYGVYTFQISSKAASRPLCAPYQGQICSWNRGDRGQVQDLNGKVYDYISIYDTSYGEPAGIFGINCGHFPETFIPGLSLARYDKPDKKQLAADNAEYEKKQEMRAMERDIRDAKTHLLAFDAARSKEGFNTWALKLNERREKYREYCINNGLDERADRLQVYGFGRSIAQAAARVDRKKL
jgi:hypothetical protein